MHAQIDSHSAYWYPGSSGLLPHPPLSTRPTIVMVHGAANDHSVWALHARYLAHHGYSVMAVDLPGHGRSGGQPLPSVELAASWLATLLQANKVKHCVLVGHSMGSLIALALAAQLFNQTDRAIQLAGIALLGSAVPMPVSNQLLELIRTDPQRAMHQINYWSFSNLNAQPGNPGPGFSTYNQNLRLMQRQGPAVLLNDFLACNQYTGGDPALELCQSHELPVLIVTGQQDRMTPLTAAQAIHTRLGNKTGSVSLTDCGHALMAQQPTVLLKALTHWLNKLS